VNGSSHPPTQRAGAEEPKGDARALRAIQRVQREQGIIGDGATDYDSFPE
jgi:hypothetical protein